MNLPSSSPALNRDPKIIFLSIMVIALLAWIVVCRQARGMEHMNLSSTMCSMPRVSSWNIADLFSLFVMWVVMMIAMMLPSVTPMALLFSKVHRTRRDQNNPFIPTWIFLLGYLLVWMGFSLLATFLQSYLHTKAWLSCCMVLTHRTIAGMILISVGIFQFTPLKNTCLSHCRSPFQFLMTQWQEGKWGAFFMGFRHGIFCTGCCWALMLLLFVTGVMNLFWIALLSILVLLEKISPKSLRINQLWGILFIVWGISIVFGKLK